MRGVSHGTYPLWFPHDHHVRSLCSPAHTTALKPFPCNEYEPDRLDHRVYRHDIATKLCESYFPCQISSLFSWEMPIVRRDKYAAVHFRWTLIHGIKHLPRFHNFFQVYLKSIHMIHRDVNFRVVEKSYWYWALSQFIFTVIYCSFDPYFKHLPCPKPILLSCPHISSHFPLFKPRSLAPCVS